MLEKLGLGLVSLIVPQALDSCVDLSTLSDWIENFNSLMTVVEVLQ